MQLSTDVCVIELKARNDLFCDNWFFCYLFTCRQFLLFAWYHKSSQVFQIGQILVTDFAGILHSVERSSSPIWNQFLIRTSSFTRPWERQMQLIWIDTKLIEKDQGTDYLFWMAIWHVVQPLAFDCFWETSVSNSWITAIIHSWKLSRYGSGRWNHCCVILNVKLCLSFAAGVVYVWVLASRLKGLIQIVFNSPSFVAWASLHCSITWETLGVD